MYAVVVEMAKNQPFTVRLEPGLEDRIGRLAKLAKRSKSSMLEELADEAERMRRYPSLGFRGPEVARRAWIVGTALDVWQVIEAFSDFGRDAERMVAETDLTRRQLDIALAYYREFRREIDEAMAANRPTAQQVEADYPFIRTVTSDK
jgi:hypothetical protein